MSWATTRSGRAVSYRNPKPEQIEMFDIVTSLSRNHRFGGFSPLKIAQHDIEVAILMMWTAELEGYTKEKVAEAGLVGLIHDLPEFIIGDIPTPLKRELSPQITEIEEAQLNNMLTMWDMHVPYYVTWNDLLHRCDKIAVHSEATRFKLDGFELDFGALQWVSVPNKWVPLDAVQPFNHVVWGEEAARQYLSLAFAKLMRCTGRGHLLRKHDDVFANYAAEPGQPMLSEWELFLPEQLDSGELFL